MQDLVLLLCLASHLFWGSWSVVQAVHTTINFDYVQYASLRFQGYFYHKEVFSQLIDKLQVV